MIIVLHVMKENKKENAWILKECVVITVIIHGRMTNVVGVVKLGERR